MTTITGGAFPYFPIDIYIKPIGGTFNINNTSVAPSVPWGKYLDYSSDVNQLEVTQYWGRQGNTAQVPMTTEYAYESGSSLQPPFVLKALDEIKIVNRLIAGPDYNPNAPNGAPSPGTIFAGVIQDPQLYRTSPNLIQWYLQCLDYSLFITNAVVNAAYSGVTIDNIVVDLVNSVTPITGVTAATVAKGGYVYPGVWVPFISFPWQTLSDAINTATTYASQNSQYGWFVDEYKQFHFYNQFQAPPPVVQLNDYNNNQLLHYSSIVSNVVTLSGGSNTDNLFPGMLVKEGVHESQIISISTADNTHFTVGALPNTTTSSTMVAWIGQQSVWDYDSGSNTYSPAILTTPYIGQIEVDTEYYYEWDATQLYNQIFVLGTMVTQPLNILLAPTDIFICDGTSRSFPLSFPVLQEDTSAVYEGIQAFVTLNNVPQTIGLQTAETGGSPPATVNNQNFGAPVIQPTAGSVIETGNQLVSVTNQAPFSGGTSTIWVITQSPSGQWFLTANTGTPTPPKGARLYVWYSYQIPNVAVATDAHSISTLGVTFQEIITDSTLLTGTAAFARAARELTEYSRVEERLNGYTTEGMVGHFNAGDVLECTLEMVPDSLNNYLMGPGSFSDGTNTFIVTNNTITFIDNGYLQYQFQALRIATSG